MRKQEAATENRPVLAPPARIEQPQMLSHVDPQRVRIRNSTLYGDRTEHILIQFTLWPDATITDLTYMTSTNTEPGEPFVIDNRVIAEAKRVVLSAKFRPIYRASGDLDQRLLREPAGHEVRVEAYQ